ncbi:MAG: NnrU protein [Halieaceae bacterium]|jgi:uncharacterized membrane protein|nr:NnrU protein [Halieaceae bacterium]
MTLLIIGLIMFACVHLIPSMAPAIKARWRGRLGEGGYKGSFALLLLASFGLMISGWRSIDPGLLYLPIEALRLPALGLIVIGFILMVTASRNSRLLQWVRHPQLTGVLLWALAHLMLNGDDRSTLLFGCMAIWSVLEIFAINRRDGVWIKGSIPGISAEIVTLIIGVVIVAITMAIHPYIAGVKVI